MNRMANNTQLNPGGLGDTIRTLDEGGVKTQAVALMGMQDSGELAYVPVTGEGHIEVAIHNPTVPFGAVHAEKLTPVFQHDAVYGINPSESRTTTTLSGSVTSANNLHICSTGTTPGGSGTLQSRRRLRYRPG